MTVTFRFQSALLERPRIRDKFDLLLGVVATFEILVEGRSVYREESFPIVELRVALDRWLRDGLPTADDFEFVSMESDEVGLVSLRRAGRGWRLASANREVAGKALLSDDEVRNTVDEFTQDVDQWVLANCGVDVSSFLELAGD